MTKLFDVNILGTKYNVFVSTPEQTPNLRTNDGFIAPEKKMIVLCKYNVDLHQKHVLIHELVHAFLYESGLDNESWGNNEEIVDWIALQLLKMSDISKKSIKQLKPFYQKSKEEKKK